MEQDEISTLMVLEVPEMHDLMGHLIKAHVLWFLCLNEMVEGFRVFLPELVLLLLQSKSDRSLLLVEVEVHDEVLQEVS